MFLLSLLIISSVGLYLFKTTQFAISFVLIALSLNLLQITYEILSIPGMLKELNDIQYKSSNQTVAQKIAEVFVGILSNVFGIKLNKGSAAAELVQITSEIIEAGIKDDYKPAPVQNNYKGKEDSKQSKGTMNAREMIRCISKGN